MSLDHSTIAVVVALSQIIITGLVLLSTYRRLTPVMIVWNVGNVLTTAGFLLFFLLRNGGSFFSQFLSNLFFLGGAVFITYTALRLTRSRGLHRFFLILLAVHSVSYLFFIYAVPHMYIRVLILTLELACVNGAAFFRLAGTLKKKQDRHFPAYILLVVFGAETCYHMFRTLYTLLHFNEGEEPFVTSWFVTLTLFGILAVVLVKTIQMQVIALSNTESQLARSNRELSKANRELQTLNEISRKSAEDIDMESIRQKIVEAMKREFGAEDAALYILQKDTGVLTLQNSSGEYAERGMLLPELTIGEGTSGKAAQTGSITIVRAENYPDEKNRSSLLRNGFTHLAGVPLKSVHGTVGAVTLFFQGKLPDRRQFSVLQVAADQFGSVLHNAILFEDLKKAKEKIEMLSHHDHLTGLYNRRPMEELLLREHGRFLRSGRSFSVVMADIDFFKQLNDSSGHQFGDQALILTAKLLRENCREADTVARWGGEEFLFLLPETGEVTAGKIINRIAEKLTKNVFRHDGKEIVLTLTFGIAEIREGETPEGVIRRADMALMYGKKHGRNEVVLSGMLAGEV